jgi:molecular chaperone GrpE
MSARHARKKDIRAAPAPEDAGPGDSSSDDEIEILEVVGINETERLSDPVPEKAPAPKRPAHAGPDTAEIERALDEARRQKDHSHDLYMRAKAELENFRKRTERDADQRRDADAAHLVGRLLPVLDNLDRALRAAGAADHPLMGGVTLVHQQLVEILGREGLAPIDTAGAAFDPHRHEAVEVVRDSGREAGAILQEMQRGYMFRDRLIRPALVRVAGGPDEEGGRNEEAGG